MPNFEPYSKRQRKREGEAEIYVYGPIPLTFRNQVIHVWHDIIGFWQTYTAASPIPESNRLWAAIHNTTAREVGRLTLRSDIPEFNFGGRPATHNAYTNTIGFFQSTTTEHVLDMIEIVF